jgi:hypothetical protein
MDELYGFWHWRIVCRVFLPDTINREKVKLQYLAKAYISVAISIFSYIFEQSDINVTN